MIPITSAPITNPEIEDYSLDVLLLEVRLEKSIAEAIDGLIPNYDFSTGSGSAFFTVSKMLAIVFSIHDA
jgi:hypothetical protein